jgi:hypothetical protein
MQLNEATAFMIKEHNRVVLTVSLPSNGLVAGDVGTVVHVYGDGKAYEVEFFTLDGHTADVVTVEANQVRAVTGREINHSRPLAA